MIGVPDARYGEELMAWVRCGSGRPSTATRSASSAGAHRPLQGPRYVKLVDEFPLTVTGKVQKFKMRERVRRGSA